MRKVAIEEREEEPFVLPELDESQIRLLGEISRSRPDAYRPSDWIGDISEFIRASVRLEMNGLIRTDEAGRRWLTAEGEQAADKIAE
ncbi:MAG TPA: hypothetical protein VJ922_04775 [Actinomycetota bacterium]|nr:hypothetical protein [Actinomycetota bacterium]